MEHNLLKTIESNFSPFYVPKEKYPRLTAYPATDYVNPGLGQICRIYSFYVPLYSHRNLHSIEKKVESTAAETQEGFGNVDSETKNENETNEIAEQMKADPIVFNSQKLKRLGSLVQESFQHPKLIKTDKLILPKAETKSKVIKDKVEKKSTTKTVQHKFNVY